MSQLCMKKVYRNGASGSGTQKQRLNEILWTIWFDKKICLRYIVEGKHDKNDFYSFRYASHKEKRLFSYFWWGKICLTNMGRYVAGYHIHNFLCAKKPWRNNSLCYIDEKNRTGIFQRYLLYKLFLSFSSWKCMKAQFFFHRIFAQKITQ